MSDIPSGGYSICEHGIPSYRGPCLECEAARPEEVPHTVLIRVEVMAESDGQAIVRAATLLPEPPGARVISYQYVGLAETPETRKSEDELHRSYSESAKRQVAARGAAKTRPTRRLYD